MNRSRLNIQKIKVDKKHTLSGVIKNKISKKNSTCKMDKITAALLDTFSQQNDITSENEPTRFEHFSNYTIISKLNRSSFELDDIHTGSGGDCAIDGLCIIVNGKIVNNTDELQDIIIGPGYLDAEIIFIQSKTTSSFNGSDIGTFIHGVKDFLSDLPRLVQNEKITKNKLTWNSLISKSSYMINRRPHCKLYYVCTGKWIGDQNLLSFIESGKQEIESIGIFDEVTITPLGASEIQKMYHETKNKLSTTITFSNRITLPDIEGVNEAYQGILPFSEFIKLIQDDNQTIHNIFDDNVRDYLSENSVNKKIKETLHNKKFELFCVLNNGVTIVASSLTPAGNRFTLRDYQIVNGCQTSNILHECQKIEGINSVNVPIRIIVTESDDIKTEITLATNNQTEVKTEQLEALSRFQKQLELYYNAEKTGVRLYYERRSQQYNSLQEIKRNQIISIPIQIKSFASLFFLSPHLVSGYYGTIANRFKGQIFAEDHKYLPYYVSSLCYYRIEQLFRNNEISADLKKARFHIMMIAKVLAIGKDELQLNSHKLEKQCESFKKTLLNDSESKELFHKAEFIFRKSGIDLTKSQYKSETDTTLLLSQIK